MLDCILKTAATLIQNITYLGTMLYLAGQHTKKLLSMRFTLCFVIYTSILYIMQLYDNTWLVTAFFIILCLYTIIIKINTGCTLSKSLNIATFGYVFASIIQAVIIFILKLFHLELDADNISNPISFLSILLTLIATILICYIFPIKTLLSKMQCLSYPVAITTITISLLIIGVVQFIERYQTGIIFPIISTLLIFIIIVLIILFEAFEDYKRKQELMSYNTYIPIVKQMINNIQNRQHLYNNQIQSLVCLANNRDLDRLVDAIDNLASTSISEDNTYDFLHLENQLLAGLLYCKFQNSIEQQKNMVFNISSYKYQSNCNDFEIVDIAGILLDNALEATTENHTIYVSIGQGLLPTKEDSKSESHKFTMKIENPGPIITDALTHSLFTKHYTTKTQSAGHGLGLSILKSTIEKHNGTITLSNTYPLGKDTPYFCIEITV